MHAFHPYQSVNYVTSHDGFTLYDLVSYDHKHNEANGENNSDGENHNRSWNCGAEGPTEDELVRVLEYPGLKRGLAWQVVLKDDKGIVLEEKATRFPVEPMASIRLRGVRPARDAGNQQLRFVMLMAALAIAVIVFQALGARRVSRRGVRPDRGSATGE